MVSGDEYLPHPSDPSLSVSARAAKPLAHPSLTGLFHPPCGTDPGADMISTTNLPQGSIDGRQAVDQPRAERVVPKPIPQSQAQNPRKYQIEQLKKRFSARESTLRNGTTNLQFKLRPSDPDFPFELAHLECELQVPAAYPEEAPTLRVRNDDIPRGFSINIEKGWDGLVRDKAGGTLLALTHALDRALESFLSEKQTDTVKLVSFKDTRHLETSAAPVGNPAAAPTAAPKPQPASPAPKPYVPEPSFTKEQITQARARRAQETRQLESRMGRMPFFHKSADGIVYTLPLDPKRRSELPLGLQTVQSVQFIVPLLYPLQALRILLNDVESSDVETLEETFATKAAQQSHMTLTTHLNYLTQNLHILAKNAQPARPANQPAVEEPPLVEGTEKTTTIQGDPDGKSHIQRIPRPPEWVIVGESDDSESDDFDSWDSDDASDEGGAAVGTKEESSSAMTHQAEHGTSMSFPSVELHGIELLQVAILSINVKCERCRTINEVTGLRPGIEKASSCKKCATPFTTRFRQELVHQNSTRAGFVDVEGCTVADMLPR